VFVARRALNLHHFSDLFRGVVELCNKKYRKNGPVPCRHSTTAGMQEVGHAWSSCRESSYVRQAPRLNI